MGVKDERSVEAEQIGYNGIEFEDSFGLNMNEMDLRQYDPAIARWVVQDPVVHHNFSPYSAFDNNPAYWTDPSGADAYGLSLDGKDVGANFDGKDVLDAYNTLLGSNNSARIFEAAIQNFYSIELNEDEDGFGIEISDDDGNGNGGGKGNKPNWTKYIPLGFTNGVEYKGNALFGSNFIGPGPDTDPRLLGLRPLDAVDYAAYLHDIAYYKAKVGGLRGAFLENHVLNADRKLVSDSMKVISGYFKGEIDPHTNRKISEHTRNVAMLVVSLFTTSNSNKSIQIKINMFFSEYRTSIINRITPYHR